MIPASTELISKFKFAGITPTCRGYSSKFRLASVTPTCRGYRGHLRRLERIWSDRADLFHHRVHLRVDERSSPAKRLRLRQARAPALHTPCMLALDRGY